ncbi:MAG: Mu-like prophage major head subunit gpT family protein [Spirochaetota bacterium]
MFPSVAHKIFNAEMARAMADFNAARELAPGLMQIAMMNPSTGAAEEYPWLGAMPVVEEWLGEATADQLEDYEYLLRNRDYVASVLINQNAIDDDQTGVLRTLAQQLATRILRHPEKLLIQAIIDGDSNAAYDGEDFFSNVSGARTIDNLLTGTGTTLAQMEADLNAALVAMAEFEDDKGEPLGIRGNVIVCPVAMENNFRRLVQSTSDPTASGGIETFNPYSGRFTVIGDPRLDADDNDDWYLFATNEPVRPFIYQLRQNAMNDMQKKPGTKQWLFTADYRGAVGYGIPHLAVKTVN